MTQFPETRESLIIAETTYGVLHRIANDKPTPICEVNSDIPVWIGHIVERLMAKRPNDRFDSAEQVAEILEDCLAHVQQPGQVKLPPCVEMLTRPDKPIDAELKIGSDLSPVSEPRASRSRRGRIWTMVALLMLAGMGLAAVQMTKPTNIAGEWKGKKWQTVSLSTVDEASNWYTGSFTNFDGGRGVMQLEWSHLQRRYNGRWKIGEELSGSVTLRAGGNELRGAVSADSDSRVPEDMPRLREFSWQRANAGVADKPHATKTYAGRAIQIQSPTKGLLVRLGERIHENAHVMKGDLIAIVEPHDATALDWLEEQVVASKQTVKSLRVLVEAKEREFAVMQANISVLQSEREKDLGSARQSISASMREADSAKMQIEAAKAELEEFTAARDHARVEFTRTKELYDQAVVSKLKLQQTERKLGESEAKLKQSEIRVQAAELNLAAQRKAQIAEEDQANVNDSYAIAELRKTESSVAKIESDIAQAKLELVDAEKAVVESQTKLSEVPRFELSAPFTGVVTKLTSQTMLKEGDTICVLLPERSKPDSQSKASAPQAPRPSQLPAERRPEHMADHWQSSEMYSHSTLESIEAATNLGKRMRDIRANLEADDQKPASIVQLNSELAAAKLQAEISATMLNGQLEAANKLLDSRTTLRDQVKRRVELADLDPPALLSAEQAVAVAVAKIDILKLWGEYYGKLQREKPTTPADDNKLVANLLGMQLEAAQTRHRFQSTLSAIARRRFELGDATMAEILEPEQAAHDTEMEVTHLEALLEYHSNDRENMRDTSSTMTENPANDGTPAEQNPIWGEPRKGLQLGITGIRNGEHFQVGSTITFSLVLKYVSKEPIRIQYTIAEQANWVKPRIESASGKEVSLAGKSAPGRLFPIVNLLQPQEVVDMQVPGILVLGDGMLADKRWPRIANPQPGQYTLRGSDGFFIVDDTGKRTACTAAHSGAVNFHVDAYESVEKPDSVKPSD